MFGFRPCILRVDYTKVSHSVIAAQNAKKLIRLARRIQGGGHENRHMAFMPCRQQTPIHVDWLNARAYPGSASESTNGSLFGPIRKQTTSKTERMTI